MDVEGLEEVILKAESAMVAEEVDVELRDEVEVELVEKVM